MNFVKSIRLLCVFIIILLGQACAVSPTAVNTPLEKPLKPDEGILVASVSLNTGEVNQFKSMSIELQSVDKKDSPPTTYVLPNVVPGLSRDTSLFIGNVPAGRYRLTKLSAGYRYLLLKGENGGLTGYIEVQQGKISDLGRIIVSAYNTQVITGRSKLITENKEMIKKYSPGFIKAMNYQHINGWVNREPKKNDVVEKYALSHPVGMGGFSELKSGHIFAGSRMGTILLRNPNGSWRLAAQTGNLNAIFTTTNYEINNNVVIGGGELGTLVRVNRKGELAHIDKGNLPLGHILFIDHDREYKNWYIGLKEKHKVSLYHSPKLEAGNWHKVLSDTIENDAWSGPRGVWIWKRDNGIGVASTEKKSLNCLDYSNGKWTKNTVPDERRLIGLSPGANDAIGILTGLSGGFAGVFAKTHFTRDCGENWIETDSPYSVKVSPPTVLPSGMIIEAGGVFGDKGLYGSNEDGKKETWVKLSNLNLINEKYLITKKNGLFILPNGGWGIETLKRSEDEGKTWTIDYSNITANPVK